MLLSSLLAPYSSEINSSVTEDHWINGIAIDSRKVQKGFIFAAPRPLAQTGVHGGAFIAEALARGAVVVLLDADFGGHLPENAPVIRVTNSPIIIAKIAATFYAPLPDTCVAVTGTSGKTSVVEFTRQLWQACGVKSASIGTLGVVRNASRQSGMLTTPDVISLAQTLGQLAGDGVSHIALEASSHGLAQYRVDGINFRAAAFTNFSRDHLDWHGSMENYFNAKQRLFSEVLPDSGIAVLNADISEYSATVNIMRKRGMRFLSYGRNGKDLCLTALESSNDGLAIGIRWQDKNYDLRLGLRGLFQAWNVMAALGLVAATDGDMEMALQATAGLAAPSGRLDLIGITRRGAAVIVDYAHKPDALRNVLQSLRSHVTGDGKLRLVFGCGGNRDAGKRPLMGAIACELADDVIITDDNPRHEDPALIRAAILAGCSNNTAVRTIADRKTAIYTACAEGMAGDVIIIAGKGHESGQIIGDITLPFDDRKVVEEILS